MAEPSVVVLTITIESRIFHTAARDRVLEAMRAFRRIAEECGEFATLRVVGDPPHSVFGGD